jgi:hypothetical protein
MGICLQIESTTVPSLEVRKNILDEARLLEEEFEWWCEPLYFLGSEDEPLHGIPKVVLPFYGMSTPEKQEFTVVEEEESFFMTARDVNFMVNKLGEWSEKYGIKWKINFEGEDLGIIKDADLNPKFLDFIERLTEPIGIRLDDPIAESKIQEILEKYGDR